MGVAACGLTRTDVKTDNDYQSIINELKSQLRVLSKEFDGLLTNRQASEARVNKSTHDISSLNSHISDLNRNIFRRDADLANIRKNAQDLAGRAHRKDAQVNSLQKLIAELKRDIQNSVEISQSKQFLIDDLKRQVSQLSQEKRSLQERAETIATYANRKKSEATDLTNKESQLALQNADLQKRYWAMHQSYQKDQNEIAKLKKEIASFSKVSHAQPQKIIPSTSQQSIRPTRQISKKSKLTAAEWNRIANRDDYSYIPAHQRGSSWVKAHYRRKSKKRRRS